MDFGNCQYMNQAFNTFGMDQVRYNNCLGS